MCLPSSPDLDVLVHIVHSGEGD
uniref:Uncharacterized protein n=1 Tax=Lepeophtheirus salmonis TaxID=72036 RepID=A0A0K2VEQ2_LEPSM